MNNIIISDFNNLDIQPNLKGDIPLIAIYRNPKDYPDKYVARLWATGSGGLRPSLYIVLADTLEDIRRSIPPGLVRLNRDIKDDPVLVETWL